MCNALQNMNMQIKIPLFSILKQYFSNMLNAKIFSVNMYFSRKNFIPRKYNVKKIDSQTLFARAQWSNKLMVEGSISSNYLASYIST